MENETYVQGDVVLRRVGRIPEGKELSHLVIAEGELTGHKHVVVGDAVLFEGDDGNLFVSVRRDGARLTHPEHPPLTLQPANYKVITPREYDHFAEEAREVKD